MNVALILERRKIQNKSLTLDQVSELLQASDDTDQADLFPAFTATEDFIRQLDRSFQHYANTFQGVKTVNALNCRKSALLSQMLLRHKVFALAGLSPSQEQSGPLFSGIIVKYSQIFLSTSTLVFDLAPYLEYLPECNPENVDNSDLINLFE